MDILVFAKQIPEVGKIEFDEATGRIRRDSVPLVTNAFDRRAIEEGLRMRERHGGRVAVATMGPPSAEQVLRDAVLMGADAGFLITDRRYAGADTLVTSRILAKFCGRVHYDAILMGKYSLDGETSQVPPEVAEMLGVPFRSSVSRIDADGGGGAVVEVENELGKADYRVTLPALFSVSEKINRARGPAREIQDFTPFLTVLGEDELQTGVGGADSPTAVVGTERVDSSRNVRMLQLNDESIDLLIRIAAEAAVRAGPEQLDPYSGGMEGEIWGVAIDDPDTAMEIAAQISRLSHQAKLLVRMVGTLDPGRLTGMSCKEYMHMGSAGNAAVADRLCSLIAAERPDHIIFPSTVNGREIAATVAARLGLGLTADCIELKVEDGKLVQFKPAFGGGVVARILSKTSPQMATVRPGAMKAGISASPFRVREIGIGGAGDEQPLSFRGRDAAYRSMASSSVVIGIGRGIGGRERMPEVMHLASLLGAAVGGTRPVVDAGYMPVQQQIGLTGYSIAPGLYIALGISGRDNHMVGVRYAGCIAAVNSRSDAPIFRYADYGIVADMYDFIERMTERLEGASAGR